MLPLRWQHLPRLPRPPAAVFAALSLTEPAGLFDGFDDEAWRELLRFCDRAQLTLVFGEVCRDHLPEWVHRRIEANLAANRTRLTRLEQDYFGIAERLERAGVEHLVLKGFPQAPRFVSDAGLRAQYDLDLLCPEPQVLRARDVILECGFEPVGSLRRFPTDHLPPMVRKTGWEWRGDYFDPDIPPVVELHFRLWDEHTERFPIPGLTAFWERRVEQLHRGRAVPAFDAGDQFGYAAIHVLRHLLRGDLKAYHVYELAHFLHTQRDDQALWQRWRAMHQPSLRQFEAMAGGLARRWFGCVLPEAVQEEINRLPREVRMWFERYAASPLTREFRPNKDELWLHLSLTSGLANRWQVVRRRLLPLTAPGPVEGVFDFEKRVPLRLRCRRWARYGGFVASRALFHVRALATLLRGGLQWSWLRLRG